MKNKTPINYEKYKPYILPISIIIVSVFIVFEVFLPQFFAISETRQKIEAQKAKVDEVSKYLNVINTMSDTDLDNNLTVASNALPNSKDILGIYLGISSASNRANVNLSNFSLKLGNIYSKDKPETAGPKTPSVSIIMEATGDSKNLIKFSDELHKTLPLAEVKKMGTAQSRGTYEVNFFYKPYNLNALARQEVVNSISPAQINLLKTLEEWLKNSK